MKKAPKKYKSPLQNLQNLLILLEKLMLLILKFYKRNKKSSIKQLLMRKLFKNR